MTAIGHLAVGAVIQKTLRKNWPSVYWLGACVISHLITDAICLWHPPSLMFGFGIGWGVFLWVFNLVGMYLLWRWARAYWVGAIVAWLGIDFEWGIKYFTGYWIGLHRLISPFPKDDKIGILTEILLTIALLIFLWRTKNRLGDE